MTLELEVDTRPADNEKTRLAVIDTDIHNFDGYDDPIFDQIFQKYLAPDWLDHHRMIGLRSYYGGGYPRAQPNAARTDSWPPSGRPPGTDLEFMREQLLDAWDMDYGILNPLTGAGGQVNREYGAQLARAINDYQIAEWLELEPRLRASMVVNYEDAELAAEEIHRLGDHEGLCANPARDAHRGAAWTPQVLEDVRGRTRLRPADRHPFRWRRQPPADLRWLAFLLY